MIDIFQAITAWYMGHINYLTITLLMAVESSFIPFPSEIVVPPAAWKAAQGELSLFLVIGSATVGAIIGAVFNYYFGLAVGKKLIYRFAATRWAELLLIDAKNIRKAEGYFRKYGRSSTLIGRLVPAVRQLISLPAGIARMSMPAFLAFTAIGAGLWNIILAILGYFLFSQKAILEKYYEAFCYGFLCLGLAFIVYLSYKILTHKRRENTGSNEPELGMAE